MNIIGKKNLYFIISLLVIIPGTLSLLFYGLKLSIDFTGGSRLEVQNSEFRIQNSETRIKKILKEQNLVLESVGKSGTDTYIVQTKPIDQNAHQKIISQLKKEFGEIKEISFETIGPTVGNETTLNAFKSVLYASVLIILYIAWSFRSVPKPASSIRFGICAIIALLHDVLVLVGVFSILGHFFGVEVDSLFVTAVLTVIGFSVHDTIVVFDRIRENLKRTSGVSFAKITNDSILQTLGRSLNTSLTVLIVLFTLLLFGGESTKWFVVALLVGITSGTYSSIFNAAPLLVLWDEFSRHSGKRV
ncbi:MAG: protein-export membrane protein SecF [Candidatus Levybacteria bacterium RIFCSPHIGHO2_12_FULL_38_12]|nr:MAG: protein-export membrane protein SecF [Candidatus Levybacteria bacterium RIFCSPHIGHO2_01_FULL_38_12]OGH21914.1 MAG: protein-export membrane protein SecF [Candidatus Levybacteria bacterium RIFCSPHIGHO2_02_FULL_37_18]OGH22846.1 MAG: protein-export membrane protein SecF [Candidatus Levybacteria bacterium RIFCSPHIGHO2_12_FULL_38_12]OGH33571.1 MAG: protein-export membrane protein SecF [Candidatus Levybacteria bacterium RIFCSPLOWO2_01_FULL_37_20]OGH44492.1 MAG: protein-export membrane protein 